MDDADAGCLSGLVGDLGWVWVVLYGLSVVAMRAFGDMGRVGLEEILSHYDESRRKRETPRVLRLLRSGHWAVEAAVVLKAVSLALIAVSFGYSGKNGGWVMVVSVAAAGEMLLDGVVSVLAAESAYYFGGALLFFLYPLRPVVWLRRPVSVVLERVLGRADSHEMHEELEGEILAIVSEGERDGVMEEVDRDVIEGLFSLKDKDVADVMTPRTDMVCVEASASVEDARRLALSSGHSRIPVFQDTRDQIVGILYVKDLLNYWNHEDRDKLRVRDVMRSPFFVPERRRVAGLLKEMQKNRNHMAIVLDEYGGTAGLVTVEDILEEYVGDIVDEYDHLDPPLYKALDGGVYRVNARMRVDEFNELLGGDLPEDEDYDTVGGLVVSRLGYIPSPGEKLWVEGVEITVTKASDRKVDEVEVRKIDSDEEER